MLALPGWNMLFTGVHEPKWSVLFLREMICSLQRLESLKRIECIMYLFSNSSLLELPAVCLYSLKKFVLQNSGTTLRVVMHTLLFSSSLQYLSFSVFFVLLPSTAEFLTLHDWYIFVVRSSWGGSWSLLYFSICWLPLVNLCWFFVIHWSFFIQLVFCQISD